MNKRWILTKIIFLYLTFSASGVTITKIRSDDLNKVTEAIGCEAILIDCKWAIGLRPGIKQITFGDKPYNVLKTFQAENVYLYCLKEFVFEHPPIKRICKGDKELTEEWESPKEFLLVFPARHPSSKTLNASPRKAYFLSNVSSLRVEGDPNSLLGAVQELAADEEGLAVGHIFSLNSSGQYELWGLFQGSEEQDIILLTPNLNTHINNLMISCMLNGCVAEAVEEESKVDHEASSVEQGSDSDRDNHVPDTSTSTLASEVDITTDGELQGGPSLSIPSLLDGTVQMYEDYHGTRNGDELSNGWQLVDQKSADNKSSWWSWLVGY